MFFFFFSSRRRHTRFDCDWSSDVCSSDLLDDARAAAMSAVLKDVPELAPMREQDLAEVMAIESAVYSHPWSRGNFADSLRAGYECRTLRLGAELVGYFILMVAAGAAHLLNLLIAAAPQRSRRRSAPPPHAAPPPR